MSKKKRTSLSSHYKKRYYQRLLKESKEVRVAPLFFILLALIALNVLFASNITGFAVLGTPVDAQVIDVLSEKGEVNILIELETPLPLQASAAQKERVWKAQADLQAFAAQHNPSTLKMRHAFSTSNYMAATVSQQGLEALKSNPNVKSIEYDRPVKLLLESSITYINATQVHATQKNGVNLTGTGQTICVIDSGINYNHQDLGGPGFPNSKILGGHDFANNDSDPLDDNGHGTHVAGIAAANGVVQGVAPDAKIVSVKAFDSEGDGQTSDIVAAIEYCTQNKSLYNISVIVMSFGSGGLLRWESTSTCLADNPSSQNAALSAARAANITLVAAAGNDGVNDGIQYPSCHPDVISVGNSDLTDTRVASSNVGVLLDVFAPGKTINSTWYTGSAAYMQLTGTSMAAPHVGGTAALIRQFESLQNNTPTRQSMLASLKSSTHTVAAAGKTFKRLDALESINALFDISISSRTIRTSSGSVTFSQEVDYSNISAAFSISDNLIVFNETFSEYNLPSNITLAGLSFTKTPVIYKNGALCSSPTCNITSYTGNLTVEIAGFSNYTSGANAQLSLWDQNDQDRDYLNISKGENITFFSNYTNVTSGSAIATGACNVSFSDGSLNNAMIYNATSELFEYTRNFTLAGLYTYNLTCADASYETLTTNDDVEILTSCGTPPDGINWTIPENRSVVCNDELITFVNQVLIMQENTSLTLNFTTFNYSFSTEQTLINASNTSTVVLNNSVIRGEGTAATLSIAGSAVLSNFTFNNTALSLTGTLNARNSSFSRVTLQGTSQATILDSTYEGDATNRFEVQSNSVLNARNLTFEGDVRLSGSSIVRLNDSIIYDALQLGGTSTLNATEQSAINTSSFSINFNTQPAMDGSFTMLATPSISALATLHRYYPILINYTNGDPVANATVNVTNSTGSLIYQTTSNASGFAKIPLNFTSSTASAQYNVSVNPMTTTALNTSTPLVFTLSTPDTTPPNVTLLSPANNTITLNTSITFTFNVSDDNETDNCSIFLDGTLNQTNTTLTNGAHNFTVGGINEGTHNWSVSCTDVNGNTNTSQTFFFTTDLTGPVVDLITTDAAQFNTNTFNLSFNTTDALSSVVNCSLFINATFDQNDSTISETVEQNFTVSRSDGSYNWSVSCVDDVTNTGSSVTRTFEVDATAPLFSNDVQSPANGSVYAPGSWTFNITVTDAHISTGILEIDGTNYTGTLNEANFTVTLPNLGAGSYSYTWYANDTFGNTNQTSGTYVILQAVPDLNLTLNGNYSDLNVTYGASTTANATSTTITPSLLRNASSVTNPQTATLAAGSYNYTASFAGNQNYSARNVSRILNVTQASSSCSLVLSPVSPQTYNTSINVSCSCTNPESSILLERNSTDVTSENNQFILLPAASYNYSCSVAQSQNYTSAQNQSSYTLNKATPVLAIASQPGTSFAYGAISNISCSANTAQVSPQLYLNGSLISSPHVTTLAAGSYNYTCNSSQTQNYTSHSVQQIITVSKATPTITLTLNSNAGDISVNTGTNVTVWTNLSISGMLNLTENGTLINTGSAPLENASVYNTTGTYTYNSSYAGNENYTSASLSRILTVNTASTPPSGGGGGGGGGGSCSATWSCSEWSACDASVQTRTCTQTNYCSNTNNKPVEIQDCVMPAVTRELGGSFIPQTSPRSSASCSDGIKNQDEEGIDCGGSCNETCVQPVVQQPQPVNSCGDGVCSSDEQCSCLADCRPENELLIVILLLIAGGVLGVLRDYPKKSKSTLAAPAKSVKKKQTKNTKAESSDEQQSARKPAFSLKRLLPKFSLSRSKDPLVRYVKDQLAKGVGKEVIRADLEKVGFSQERIKEVLK